VRIHERPDLAEGDVAEDARREHAAWALLDMGVTAVIAPSFSDIFAGNAYKNGIVTVALPQEAIDRLMEVAETDPITIDLESQTVTTPFQDRWRFEMDPFRKHCLVEGKDDVDITLQSAAAIEAYEDRQRAAQPWVARGTGLAA
jgi:3-isopropylmalate/(R)-2-methylmalate dehydratase small subunit